MYLSTLKVEYSRTPRNYKLILQDIASEVSSKKTTTFGGTAQISCTATDNHNQYTKSGRCPDQGVHTSDGKIYIGSYSPQRWRQDDVRPYHDEIRTARSQSSGGNGTGQHNSTHPSRKAKKLRNELKRTKRKLSKLQSVVNELRTDANDQTNDNTNDNNNTNDNAGDSFGGRNAMKKKKSS